METRIKEHPITRAFSEFVAGFNSNLVSTQVCKIAKASIKDTVGVMIESSHEASIQILKDYTSLVGGNPQSNIIGVAEKTSFVNAARVNAAMSHVTDFDDCASFGHSGAVLVPTILAIGQWQSLPGNELLNGFIVGFEIGSRIGSFLSEKYYDKIWHSTAVIGTIAATATASYLLKLTRKQVQNAFGIAAATVVGLHANFGTNTKSLSPANAVVNALEAALFAKDGFTANPNIFEAKNGYFDLFGGSDSNYKSMLDGLGQKPLQLEAPGLWIKKWPCCYSLIPCIRLVQLLKEKHSFSPHQIISIEYRANHVDGFLNKPLVKNTLHAKFSFQFMIPCAFLENEITNESFTDEKIQNKELKRLMKLLTLKKLNKNDKTGFYLVVQLNNGKKYHAHIPEIYHSLKDQEIDEKFKKNAIKRLSKKQVSKVAALLDQFETLKNLDELMRELI